MAMKILLPMDDSDCSAAALLAVVRQFQPQDAEVRVMHVDEWPKGMPVSLAFAEGHEAAHHILAVHQEQRQRSRDVMACAVRRLTAAHFKASSELRDGDARREILAAAAEWRPDVVVMGSHGRNGLQRFLLGSVSDSVVRHAPCSVEVVRTPNGSASGGEQVLT
jgi:universal stress protein A